MKFRFFFTLLALLVFSVFAAAQTEETGEDVAVIVPDKVLSQVVQRILSWNFKPAKRPKTIYLAAQNINQSELPSIKNIEFKLLSDDEVRDREKKVYFFTKLEKTSKTPYQIGFAFGNPNCESDGREWYFRFSANKVRLWIPKIGFGFGCTVADRGSSELLKGN